MNVNIDSISCVAEPRLGAFPANQVERIKKAMGGVRDVESTPWPKIDGCLVVLFTARSGSTYLTRELELAFAIGRMEEALNPVHLEALTAQDIVRARQDGWFGFKAGLKGIIAAELTGFFAAYLKQTSFIRLMRRDIVAQSVSLAKAQQTRQWHATNEPTQAAAYDAEWIGKAVKKIAAGVEQLKLYADECGRPSRCVFYEDFATGNMRSPLATGDSLRIPRRAAGDVISPRPVEKMGDEVNDEWRARFETDMSGKTRRIIERYQASMRS